MPNNLIKSYASKTGKSEQELENKWKSAKSVAKKQDQEDNFQFITGVWKRMIGEQYKPFFKEIESSSISPTPQNAIKKKDIEDEEGNLLKP